MRLEVTLLVGLVVAAGALIFFARLPQAWGHALLRSLSGC